MSMNETNLKGEHCQGTNFLTAISN